MDLDKITNRCLACGRVFFPYVGFFAYGKNVSLKDTVVCGSCYRRKYPRPIEINSVIQTRLK